MMHTSVIRTFPKPPTSALKSSLGLHIQPHREEEEVLGLHTLETLIQTLATNGEVIGLEIAYTQTGPCFLVRATSEATLWQMSKHLHARYPQASVERLDP